MRREDIPPSQGGKYTGFGSKPLHINNDETSNENLVQLQKGLSNSWNFITNTVSSLNKNVIKPASDVVRNPNFSKNIENYAENIKRSLTEKAYIAKDQFNQAVQNFQQKNNNKINKNNDDDLILTNMDESENYGNKLGNEPYIVIDYDYIENNSDNDNDIFNLSRSSSNIMINENNNNNNNSFNNSNNNNNNINVNNNDFTSRRTSVNSFTSLNESLSRAYSIGSSNSMMSIKMTRSNRSSMSNNSNFLKSPIT
ncbi:hypothetical protein BCR32DRAFT_324951 [Anaeromyces robustus]|uniref:Uncharacterized protein n=1 Tax=Anaeromyces robustus TaxID=1754192 RepID=A0A1Y1XM46_9FUNG|nr:hypothetical protein BCR32DRAFT_324951 [Anaeromyces robustus]|eukprot:ORX86414.1 hypothetical protein BCR32DRAFT_324951 [Anaeromyces robustus]